MEWGLVGILVIVGAFVWWLQKSSSERPDTITLDWGRDVRARFAALRSQTGLTTVQIFRAALRTYEYTVQQRLDGATFYQNQTPCRGATMYPTTSQKTNLSP